MKMKIRRAKWLLLVSVLCTSLAAAASGGVLIKDETLYAKPAARSASVGRVVRGTPVTVVARQGGWLEVTSGRTRGWVRMFSVRGSVGGGGNTAAELAGLVQAGQRRPGNIVATAGVRGLNEEDLKTARYSEPGIQDLASYSVSAGAARQFAGKARLSRQNVAYLPNPAGSGDENRNNAWEVPQ
ncbi:SH3 domain-containing protein [Sulfuriferula plumbiphila]|nr:SH3 domain-containing protein [Sulfuriferula plumbiphila]